jgi:acetolactate synthase-1/2/3 large subunit
MTTAELLIRCLEHEEVRFVFGVPGEETLDITDALLDSSIQFIPARHEQGAAFMADVYGRLSGKAGVCLSTLGPGATNLVTGIADAYLDRAPLVALTGQASLNRMHKESHQYVDIHAMFRPITKWNADLFTPEMVPEAVRKAFQVAQTEKPGAVHLELPEDVAGRSIIDMRSCTPLPFQAPVLPEPLPGQIDKAVEIIGKARRPLLLVGNGLVRGQAQDALRQFARRLGMPVVHTFMAKGVMPDSDPLSLFTVGLQMRDYVAAVLDKCDLVVAVGYDLVEYAPCFWNPDCDKQIVHVDASPAEIDAHYVADVEVLGDISLALSALAESLSNVDRRWGRSCRERLSLGFENEYAESDAWPMRPQHIVRELRRALGDDGLVLCDVGAHKLWMARMFPCEEPNMCVVSNGFAAMGIALPGAIGAQLLYPHRRVIAVTGDAGFLMNSQELETAVRYDLPIIVLVWRDDGYGVIGWKQQLRFGRISGVTFGNPNLVDYARSFGAAGFRVESPTSFGDVFREALSCGKPAVIDCPVDYGENLRLSNRLKSLVRPHIAASLSRGSIF